MGNISTPPQFQGPPRSDDPYAGGIMTKHGWFSYADIDEAGGKVGYDRNGERVLQFPYAKDSEGKPVYRAIPDHVVKQHEDDQDVRTERSGG